MAQHSKLETEWRRVRGHDWLPPDTLLALDPGATTGWAVCSRGAFTACGQIAGNADQLTALLSLYQPTVVIYEEFHLFLWKAQSQAYSDMPTSRLIGNLEVLCAQRAVLLLGQTPRDAKGLVADATLRDLFLYQPHQQHANDALRHAVYGLLCNKQLPQGTQAASEDVRWR